jgi:hypothetical protein
MFKLIVFFVFLSVGVYLYTQFGFNFKAQEIITGQIGHNSLKQHSSLEQKELFKAFEKILHRKNGESRELASVDESEGKANFGEVGNENSSKDSDKDIDSENIDRESETGKDLFEEDYEREFENMSLSEKEMTVRNLEFAIKHDIKLVEQIESDQEEGLETTEHNLDVINLRIENNNNKLEFLKFKMSEERE